MCVRIFNGGSFKIDFEIVSYITFPLVISVETSTSVEAKSPTSPRKQLDHLYNTRTLWDSESSFQQIKIMETQSQSRYRRREMARKITKWKWNLDRIARFVGPEFNPVHKCIDYQRNVSFPGLLMDIHRQGHTGTGSDFFPWSSTESIRRRV